MKIPQVEGYLGVLVKRKVDAANCKKLEKRLKDLIAPDSIWVHPHVEWKQEVFHDDTLLGYIEWLNQKIAEAKHE